MTKRITHENDAIEGLEVTAGYAQRHKKNARAHYNAFLRELESLDIRGKCLEIGSGPGFLTAMVARANPQLEITALELSKDMIDFAERPVQEEGIGDRVRFVQGNAENAGVLQSLGPFDLVYSTFSLHHWEKPLRVIKNIYRTVAEKGTLLIHDLRRVWWLYYLPPTNGFLKSIRAAYKVKEVRNMLDQIGVHYYRTKIPFPFFWMSIIAKKT